MNYNIFINSTPADNDTMNENYYYIAQGSRFPMNNQSCEYTTSSYDIGSSSYKWSNIFCNNLYIHSGSSLEYSVMSYYVTANTTRIEISGLSLNPTNDSCHSYFIYVDGRSYASTDYLRMYQNGDSTTAHIHSHYGIIETGTAVYGISNSHTSIKFQGNTFAIVKYMNRRYFPNTYLAFQRTTFQYDNHDFLVGTTGAYLGKSISYFTGCYAGDPEITITTSLVFTGYMAPKTRIIIRGNK